MTEYIHDVTVFCPELKMSDCNQLAGFTAESLADVNTYRVINGKDAAGNRYSIIHTVVRPTFLGKINEGKAGVLPYPDYDPDHTLDREAAQRATRSNRHRPPAGHSSGWAGID